MGQIKDFLGLTIGVTLLGRTVLPAIGAGFSGSLSGLGKATQTIVAGGFVGSAAKKIKFI